jgi:hypothetical protein
LLIGCYRFIIASLVIARCGILAHTTPIDYKNIGIAKFQLARYSLCLSHVFYRWILFLLKDSSLLLFALCLDPHCDTHSCKVLQEKNIIGHTIIGHKGIAGKNILGGLCKRTERMSLNIYFGACKLSFLHMPQKITFFRDTSCAAI